MTIKPGTLLQGEVARYSRSGWSTNIEILMYIETKEKVPGSAGFQHICLSLGGFIEVFSSILPLKEWIEKNELEIVG